MQVNNFIHLLNVLMGFEPVKLRERTNKRRMTKRVKE